MKRKTKETAAALAMAAVILMLVLAPSAMAAEEAGIAITVTVQYLEIGVSPTAYAFGTMVAGATGSTWVNGTGMYYTATNGGNVAEDFTIKGADATGGAFTWTLASTQGADQYSMKAGTDGTSGTETTYSTTLTTSAQAFASGIASSGTQDFDLQIGVPTSSTSTVEMSTTVTLGVVAA